MKIEYTNVNANKLHDELIAAEIVPFLVESLDGTTWITYADDTDMAIVDDVVAAHDPVPVVMPTQEEVQEAETKVLITETLIELGVLV